MHVFLLGLFDIFGGLIRNARIRCSLYLNLTTFFPAHGAAVTCGITDEAIVTCGFR
jgi:hypothetical protein